MKKDIKKLKENKFIKEFKDFIAKGNVVDLAVGVIIGSAFGKIVSSVVSDILMPIIGVIIGGHDFTSIKLTFGNANIMIGNFIQNVIDFLIIALCIFIFVKVIKRYNDIFVKTAKLYGGLFIKSSQAVLQHKQGAMRNHHLLKQVPEVLQNIICHDALAETAIIHHSLFCRKQTE